MIMKMPASCVSALRLPHRRGFWEKSVPPGPAIASALQRRGMCACLKPMTHTRFWPSSRSASCISRGRTFEKVLDDVSYAVFREDFQRGFGADGDHLKTPEEVAYALSCGYTMITLDCSEHIHGEAAEMTDEAVAESYEPDAAIEARYLGKRFTVGSHTLTFTPELLRRTS